MPRTSRKKRLKFSRLLCSSSLRRYGNPVARIDSESEVVGETRSGVPLSQAPSPAIAVNSSPKSGR